MKSLIIAAIFITGFIATAGVKKQQVFADSITMTLADNDLQVTVNATKSLPYVHADNQSITVGNVTNTNGKFPSQPIIINTGTSSGSSNNGRSQAGAGSDYLRGQLNSTGTLKTCQMTGQVGPCWDTARKSLHE